MTDKIEIIEDETDTSRRAITLRLGLIAVSTFVAPMALTVNEANAGQSSKKKLKKRKYKNSKSSKSSYRSKSSKSSKSSGHSKASKPEIDTIPPD